MPPKKASAEVDEAAAAEAEKLQQGTALVAATFANVELQTAKRTLEHYANLYAATKEENGRLQKELQDRDADAMAVVQFLRSDLEARQEQLKEATRAAAAAEEMARLREEARCADLATEIAARDDQLHEAAVEAERLRTELGLLEAFRDERAELRAEMARFHSEHDAAVERYEAELSRQRFLSLEDKVRLKAEERGLKERYEADVHTKAMELLDAKTKAIHEENFALLREKAALGSEVERLEDSLRDVTLELTALRRERDLTEAGDSEHARRSVRRAREVKGLREKLTAAEEAAGAAMRAADARVERSERQHAKTAAQLSREKEDAVRTARMVQRDFAKMRQLTRGVVQQRSDLELFFTEALGFVREQIRDAAALPGPSSQLQQRRPRGEGRALQATTSVPVLPPLARSTPSRPSKAIEDTAPEEAAGADIRDLSWEDKERVLRILFAKINTAARRDPSADGLQQPIAAIEDAHGTAFLTQQ